MGIRRNRLEGAVGSKHYRFEGSFTPSGGAVSSASGATRGKNFTPSHSGTAGIYRITLKNDLGDVQPFVRLIRANANFQAENAYARPTECCIGAVNEANGTIDIKVFDEAAPLEGNATHDPANLVDGAGVTTTVNVPGAALGDYVVPSASVDLQGITVTAYVSSSNVVSVRYQNETGGAIDLASHTLRARVFPVTNGLKQLRNVTASGVLRRINFEITVALEDIPGEGASA
jgi:hypothetical protein